MTDAQHGTWSPPGSPHPPGSTVDAGVAGGGVTVTDEAGMLAFAHARLAEEEADARAAMAAFSPARGYWSVNGGVPNVINADSGLGPMPTTQIIGRLDSAAMAVHAARQDPAATLARVVALWAAIAPHEPAGFEFPSIPPWCDRCLDAEAELGGAEAWPCEAIRLLVAIWNWHPEYRTEWKPRSLPR